MQQTMLIFTISSVGFLSLLKPLFSFLNWLYTYFLRPPKNLLTTYGSWAIITGSTDGIGKALAFYLAKQGHHLLLVGRNPEKLKQVTNQIYSTSPKTDIKTLVLDFSGDLKDGVGRLREAITGLDVGILVNNAGMTYPSAMYFHEVDEELWRNVIKVNLEGLSMVTKAVLPGMLKRNRGAIVNIGSGASSAIPSHPLFAVYAATKAYVESFTRSLHVEYKHQGIDVQCQIPMYVATKMVPFKSGSSFFTPSPDRFAEAAVRRIGYESRCTPYWTHSLQWWLASWPPDAALNAWRLCHGLSRRIDPNSEHASRKIFS